MQKCVFVLLPSRTALRVHVEGRYRDVLLVICLCISFNFPARATEPCDTASDFYSLSNVSAGWLYEENIGKLNRTQKSSAYPKYSHNKCNMLYSWVV